jgi:serine phosphatase RsbU (regulator of sigma subunit)/anti-sigma regulatory factor (Ser/Thr protein kinase)
MNSQTRILTGIIEASFVTATSAWVHALIDEFKIGDKDAYSIDLCLEELVANIVNYAEPQFQGTRVDIRAVIVPQRIVVTLIDSAQPYDPLAEHRPRELTQNIDDYMIGGHGITMVKEFSSACRYEYRDGQNQLELVFDLVQPLVSYDLSQKTPRGLERRKFDDQSRFPLTAVSGEQVDQDRYRGVDRRKFGILSRAAILRDVPYSLIESLTETASVQQFVAKTTLLRPGDENRNVLFVLEGCVKVGLGTTESDGDVINISVGHCVGEMSVIDNRPVSAFVMVDPGTRLLLVSAQLFLDELLARPKVSRNLLSTMSERIRRNSDLIIKRVRLEAEVELLHRELSVAKEIQESLLPREPLFSDDARIDCKGRMCAAKEVGGDFYDAFFLDRNKLFFVIGDVCGKGLPAALFMVRAVSALRAQSGSDHLSPGYVSEVIGRLNMQLCTHNDKQQFLTAFCGILDLETRTILYLNAGHNAPVLALGDQEFEYIGDPINPMVGMVDGLNYRAGMVTLSPGSTLILYTDGVTEAETHDISMFGEDRLLQCLNAVSDRSAGTLVETVFAAVNDFAAGAAQSDDITMLAIRCH